MLRPVIFVLAGVNGAGKSSVGGHLLERQEMTWFNPDSFARELIAASGCSQQDANGRAWAEGMRRLEEAVKGGTNYAFETTLGGNVVPARIKAAARTHEVLMWFCGLASPEQHIARVKARVAAGGHNIPEAKIRERFVNAQGNLINLMPHLTHLQVWDNSTEAAPGESIPDPMLVLEMEDARVHYPELDDASALAATPEWARAIVEAAITLRSQ